MATACHPSCVATDVCPSLDMGFHDVALLTSVTSLPPCCVSLHFSHDWPFWTFLPLSHHLGLSEGINS